MCSIYFCCKNTWTDTEFDVLTAMKVALLFLFCTWIFCENILLKLVVLYFGVPMVFLLIVKEFVNQLILETLLYLAISWNNRF